MKDDEIMVSGPLKMVIEYLNTECPDLEDPKTITDELLKNQSHNVAVLGSLGYLLYTEFKKVA